MKKVDLDYIYVLLGAKWNSGFFRILLLHPMDVHLVTSTTLLTMPEITFVERDGL